MKKALDDADGAVSKHDLSLKNLAGTIGSAYAAKAVIEFGKASVEAAAADEAAQVKLATQLRNTTGATDAQVASVEAWITKTMFATNTADDELRPALARLVTATGDVESAQSLMGVALDVSVGKNKSLQSVAEALAKAQDGNVSALSRLGVATKDAEGKTLSFDQIVKDLSTTFAGQAANATETQAGKLENMKLRFGELQEQIGTALMPVMEQLVGILGGLTKWFSSLDEDTQAWIIRIGMLGGGLVLATRAVTGITSALGGTTAGLKVLGKAMFAHPILTLAGLAVGVAAAVGLFGDESDEAAGRVRNLRDAITEAGSVMGGLTAYITGIVGESDHLAAAMASTGVTVDELQASVAKVGTGDASAFDDLVDRLLEAGEAAGLSDIEMIQLGHSLLKLPGDAQAAETAAKNLTAATRATAQEAGTAERQWIALGVALAAGKVSLDDVRGATDRGTTATGTAERQWIALGEALAATQASVEALDTEYRELTGNLSEREAWLNLLDTMDGFRAKMQTGTLSTRQQEQATIDFSQEILGLIEDLEGVPPETKAKLVDQVERGELDRTMADLRKLQSTSHVVKVAVKTSGASLALNDVLHSGKVPGYDTGGVVGGALGSPQLILAHGGETILPTHKKMLIPSGVAGIGGGGAGGTTNVYNFHGPVMGEQDFIRRLEEGRQDAIRRGALLVPA